MGETFYTALGVDSDADASAVREAYRKRVKDYHPDVSDDPASPTAFKRLTVARDVLADAERRRAYDRLGHARYVERHLSGSAWRPESDAASSEPTGTSDDERRRRAAGRTQPNVSAWWTADPGREPTPAGGSTPSAQREGHWQQASAAYRSAPPSRPAPSVPWTAKLGAALRSLGPWLLVYVVFLLSAAGAGTLVSAQVGTASVLAVPAAAGGLALFGLSLFITALHAMRRLYA